jgi:hypothetical protein
VELTGLLEDLRDRMRPLRSRLVPRQVLLELHDEKLLGQVLRDDGEAGPLVIDVPLPPLTCRDGMPLEKEPLGDLIGDLLVRDDLIDAFVMAALPPAASAWRLLEWQAEELPEDPLEAVRHLEGSMQLPFGLEQASVDLVPLPGSPPRMLLAAARSDLVEAWIEVFNLAGVQLDRLAPPQACLLAALTPLLAERPPGELVALVDPGVEDGRLLLLREGVPVFDWPLPADPAAAVAEVSRALAFYRRRDAGVASVRLLLARPFPDRPGLEAELGVAAEELSADPFASLVLQGLATPEVAA